MKNNWKKYLHLIRENEINICFQGYNKKQFHLGLELGAGDGFQSSLIADYCKELICTELNEERLKRKSIKNISYQICDAEKIDTYFNNKFFDLIFSSNMFEHLPNPEDALCSISKILRNDGILIIIVPSFFWKLCHMTLNYPVTIYRTIKRKLLNPKKVNLTNDKERTTNNLKLKRIKRNFILEKIRWPRPHGVADNNFQEFVRFRKKYWINLFNKNNYNIIDYKKGPITSGYGLNFNLIRSFLQYLGFTSEYIFYLKIKK